jgi:membrane protease YdiL (CAAX protease family)
MFITFTAVIMAAIMMLIIFGLKLVPFWPGISIASVILAIWSIVTAGTERQKIFSLKAWHIIWGLISAVLLYLIFFTGNYFSKLLIESAFEQIGTFYSLLSGQNILVIGLLMFFLIGPAEEIFWRGMIQRKLQSRIGGLYGWILAAVLYALVHIWAANFMLVMAALVGGLFWGWLFKRTGSLWPGIISHAVWDILVFLIFPFQ